MKIKVKLGDIQSAINQVEAYKNGLVEKTRIFLERLAEIGIAEADTRFKVAIYDGTNDVTVGDPVWIADNRIAIRATGESVTFIEFGAGVYYGEQHEKAQELGFNRGEYGKGQGKHNYWFYKGEPGTNGEESTAIPGLIITHGNPPNRCLWEADKKIRKQLLKIAKEVFGND